MKCEKCGKKVRKHKYCTNCGTKAIHKYEINDNTQILKKLNTDDEKVTESKIRKNENEEIRKIKKQQQRKKEKGNVKHTKRNLARNSNHSLLLRFLDSFKMTCLLGLIFIALTIYSITNFGKTIKPRYSLERYPEAYEQLSLGNVDEAIELYLDAFGDENIMYLVLAQDLYFKSLYEKSNEVIDFGIKTVPLAETDRLYDLKAINFYEMGLIKEFLEAYDIRSELGEPSIELQFLLAKLHEKNREFEVEEKLYNDIFSSLVKEQETTQIMEYLTRYLMERQIESDSRLKNIDELIIKIIIDSNLLDNNDFLSIIDALIVEKEYDEASTLVNSLMKNNINMSFFENTIDVLDVKRERGTVYSTVNDGYLTITIPDKYKGSVPHIYINGTRKVGFVLIKEYNGYISFRSKHRVIEKNVVQDLEINCESRDETNLTRIYRDIVFIDGPISDIDKPYVKIIETYSFESTDNDISGNILDLNKFKELTHIYIPNAKIEGKIGDLDLPNLVHIDISYSNVMGEINQLKQMDNLENLSLLGLKITGEISDMSKFKNLKVLSIANTKIKMDLSVLKDCYALEELYVYGSGTYGNLLNLEKLYMMKALYASSTKIEGDISILSGLKNIKSLDFNNTSVYGNTFELINLPKLRLLRIKNTEIVCDSIYDKYFNSELEIEKD